MDADVDDSVDGDDAVDDPYMANINNAAVDDAVINVKDQPKYGAAWHRRQRYIRGVIKRGGTAELAKQKLSQKCHERGFKKRGREIAAAVGAPVPA